MLILQGIFNTSISVDKITKFSVRPPELRHVIRKPGKYYRWYYVTSKGLDRETINSMLHDDIKKSILIDGLGNQVFIRVKAFKEIRKELEENIVETSIEHPRFLMKTFLLDIINLYSLYNEQISSDGCSEYQEWCFIKHHFLYDDDKRHIPIPVYSYVKPTMGPRFILHVMLSLGEFDTEIDLILQGSLKNALRYAKLIGEEDDEESNQMHSFGLLKKFIEEQLIYFPNSGNILDQWIVTAGNLWDSVILRDEIPISDLPPCHQKALNNSKEEEVIQMWSKLRGNLLRSAFREMDNSVQIYNIPPMDEIKECDRGSPLIWDPISNFKKNDRQNNQSFEDQKQAVIHSIRSINKYLECSTQTSFVKCCVIAGSPGSGKSFLLNYVGIYAMSKGLNVVVTSLMARRSIHLGGIHLHKLFFLPVKSMDIHKMAESSLRSLLQNPVSLSILKMIDIILLDEVGQISSELLSCLDLILRKIRSNNIFLGGILFICTLDHKQLQPINGRPFLTSPMVISCFDFVCLKESVRASGDINLQRIQQIARMNPSEYKKNPQLISEFKELISSTCTFVDNWNHEIITPTTYRLYGKKYPARKAIQEYIDQVQSKLSVNEMRIVKSKDMQTPQLSHQEWTQATESTSNGLDQKCKELRTLLFCGFCTTTNLLISRKHNLVLCWIYHHKMM